MASEINKVPPHNEEAEQSFLGALLIDPEAIIKVADHVDPEQFYFEKHRKIYGGMIDLYAKHEPIDLLSLGNRLDEMGSLANLGGRSYLAELTNIVPTASNVVHYGDIIQKKATLRRLISAASKISQLGFDESTDDIASVLDQAESTMFGVASTHLKQSFTHIRSILADAFERIDTLHKERGKLRGVPSGYVALDNLLAGFQKADLIILAARPSVGKTAFALSLARHASVKLKIPVGLFSLEMSKEQLVDRLICAEADIDLWKLRTGKLSDRDDDFPRIGQALGVLSEAPLYIDDSASANIMEIRAKCRRLKSEHGLGMVIIDYLQLMESRGAKENRVQEVAEISRGLKQIARELEIPIIALSQLSRTVEMSKPAIPKLSHLRESGSIEQDADVVMFIYRKAADKNYQPDELSPEEKNLAEVHISKHRNGPTGIVKLFFDATRANFKNLERRMEPPIASAPKPVESPPLPRSHG
ncbi:replicative DNA helicase [Candidatus Uhrbacteria bacterium CG10_big_fil_rev_8_21_14_0_10_50_16]|uniref:Replicative DNA helicase n=1 Tax=Candidatus Uhrbacteria bacterium CG10_big_fil_rev_8_21_14_0_10_50_16 TaxID=1975039 RepID=A0A2H0RMX4_9BACT|nr:MAG: replicative DNA helicase [Candidatus Uhrbacteria bacterium CG10_big_fil_rev_8_21_14_0_10_50_16]